MGASMSTLVGWAVIVVIVGYWGYKSWADKQSRLPAKAAQRLKADDRQPMQNRKNPKEKAKRQRADAAHQATLAAAKEVSAEPATKPKARSNNKSNNNKNTNKNTTNTTTTTTNTNNKTPTVSTTLVSSPSSDDDVLDNREFARQLASVKQGTTFTANKSEEKKQKSVKQSRAREMAQESLQPAENKAVVSAPSSTAGIDGDDDTSAAASPSVRPADASGVADMLEAPAVGPSVMRLTDTDKVKQKETKAPAVPEKTETKKQRQNRKKAEAARAEREEAERERKIALEAQRKAAREAEGRAAQDGSAFMAAQQSAWTNNHNHNNTASNGINGTKANTIPAETTSQSLHVQQPAPAASKAHSWMRDLPSEEEQMELLRSSEEAWSTVKTKKFKKRLDGPAYESAGEAETQGAVHAESRAPARGSSVPAAAATAAASAAVSKAQAQPQAQSKPSAASNGGTAKVFSHQSSFAALSTHNGEVEQEWDV